MNKLKVIELEVDRLIPYERNPRRNDDSVDAVSASIRDFGFKVPIILDKDNVIIAGHTRLKAAKKLGLEKVPCIIADDLTPEQVKAFRLADNKTAEMAEWDFNALAAELEAIQQDMGQYGFYVDPEEIEGEIITEFELPDGEKPDVNTLTFTVSAVQKEQILEAFEDVRDQIREFGDSSNDNGDALAEICRQILEA